MSLKTIFKRKCANINTDWVNPCSKLVKTYYPEFDYLEYFESDFHEQANLENFSDQRINKVINERTKIVNRKELHGVNGISCIGYNFVAEDLPPHAKRYVLTHEAIHLLGERDETKTNYIAGKKEPLGLIQTVVYSLFHGAEDTKLSEYPCRIGAAWNIFKVYFLNAKPGI